MNTDDTISTKQIRDNLVPFLKSLEDGRTVTVLHRSKPLVRLRASGDVGKYEAPDAGTNAAARRIVRRIESMPVRKSKLDPNKSFKQLYEETRTLDDTS